MSGLLTDTRFPELLGHAPHRSITQETWLSLTINTKSTAPRMSTQISRGPSSFSLRSDTNRKKSLYFLDWQVHVYCKKIPNTKYTSAWLPSDTSHTAVHTHDNPLTISSISTRKGAYIPEDTVHIFRRSMSDILRKSAWHDNSYKYPEIRCIQRMNDWDTRLWDAIVVWLYPDQYDLCQNIVGNVNRW